MNIVAESFAKMIEALTISGQIKNASHLSEEIGITKSAIYDIINGRVKKLSGTMIKLLRIQYNINPAWLQTGEGEMFLQPDTDQIVLDIETMRAVIEAVEDLFQKNNLYLTPKKKAEYIILLYEYFKEDDIDLNSEKGQKKILDLARLAG